MDDLNLFLPVSTWTRARLHKKAMPVELKHPRSSHTSPPVSLSLSDYTVQIKPFTLVFLTAGANNKTCCFLQKCCKSRIVNLHGTNPPPPPCLLTVEYSNTDEGTAGREMQSDVAVGGWFWCFSTGWRDTSRDGTRGRHTQMEVRDEETSMTTKATAFNMKQNFRGSLRALSPWQQHT